MNKPALKIRIATKADSENLALTAKAWCDEMRYDVDLIELREDVERMIDEGCAIYVMVEEEIVGIMTGLIIHHFWVKQKLAHEHWFFVKPNFRRTGIGKILAESFCVWAKQLGCHGAMIYPNCFGSTDPENIKGYLERIGFHLHGFQMRKDL